MKMSEALAMLASAILVFGFKLGMFGRFCTVYGIFQVTSDTLAPGLWQRSRQIR